MAVRHASLDEIEAFHEQLVASRPMRVSVVGDLARIGRASLEAFGEVHDIQPSRVLGY
jgi:hypothetical protein